MGSNLTIVVATLDASHRRALEEVVGCELAANQRLIISVIDVAVSQGSAPMPAQTLADWTGVYAGLSDAEIEAVDKVAKTRANLTRNLP